MFFFFTFYFIPNTHIYYAWHGVLQTLRLAYTHTHTHICQSQACVTFCSQLICVIVSYNMWYMRVAIHITAHVCWLHIIEVRMSIWLCVKYYAFNNDLVTSTMSSHKKICDCMPVWVTIAWILISFHGSLFL